MRKKAQSIQSFYKTIKKNLNIYDKQEKDLKKSKEIRRKKRTDERKNSKEILRKKPKNPEKIAKKC